jgi:hypothetical protein
LRQPVLWDDRKCRLFLEILRAFWDDPFNFYKGSSKEEQYNGAAQGQPLRNGQTVGLFSKEASMFRHQNVQH